MQSNTSITRAKKWLTLFDDKFDRKFTFPMSMSKRESYWSFIVKGIDKVVDCRDPVARLICIVGVAKRANCGMLPPRGAADMYSSCLAMFSTNAPSYSTGTTNVDDSKIPDAISKAIQDLPNDIYKETDIRTYLKDHVFSTLRQDGHHINSWVDNELSYWSKDFATLASELAEKLHLEEDELKKQDKDDKQAADERTAQYHARSKEFMDKLAEHGVSDCMS